jgi:sugar lactone lactonase YvrE
MAKRLMLALIALVVCAGLYAPTPASADSRPTHYILPGDAVFPEGVAFQQSTGNFYVSSAADGTIFRGRISDEKAKVFLRGGKNGRSSATGLKVDREGHLFVSGAATGLIFIYDTKTGDLIRKFDNDLATTFINDVVIAPDGAAYFTDSFSPFLYKVSANTSGKFSFERWIDFTGTALVYQTGFNANGIVATPDGKYLIVVQSNTGQLFRITIATKKVVAIDLGGETVTNGDGLLLRGHNLYVVRNQQELIVKVKMADNFASGKVVSSTTDPSFAFPTTIAEAHDRLLVVNSQFDKQGPGLTPVLPFTVSSVHIP